MTCSNFISLLTDYFDNNLDAADTKAFEDHLRSCGSCKIKFDDTARYIDLIKRVDPVKAPSNFKDELINRSKGEFNGRIGRRSLSRTRIISYGIAAAVLLIFIVLIPDSWYEMQTIETTYVPKIEKKGKGPKRGDPIRELKLNVIKSKVSSLDSIATLFGKDIRITHKTDDQNLPVYAKIKIRKHRYADLTEHLEELFPDSNFPTEPEFSLSRYCDINIKFEIE
jgi:hypothetical protein